MKIITLQGDVRKSKGILILTNENELVCSSFEILAWTKLLMHLLAIAVHY
jgi:hypothetical protein